MSAAGSPPPGAVTVVPYDATWPESFRQIAGEVRRALGCGPHGVEHVGSTAVPRLAAKPVIDLLVVAESDAGIPRAIAALEAGGWSHQGDGGLPGRERFTSRSGLPYHHLYRRPGQ